MAKGKAKSDLNKLQAVREVLDAKGKDTVPTEIQKIIKQKHGVELSTSLISSYKFKLVGAVRKKGGKPTAPAAHPAARQGGSVTSVEKRAFPTKTCPKCSEPIHARSHKHEACGWVMAANGVAGKTSHPANKSTNGRRSGTVGGITVDDIEAVKKLVDSMGAEKVRQLAQVLA